MLGAKLFGKLDERRVRLLLAAFFVALAIPAVVLIAQAYSQLKWQSFRVNQQLAEDVVTRVDTELRSAVSAEGARSFGDYAFLVVTGDAAANFVQRSPLAAFPVASPVPGVLGYFQVDADGKLSTPLLPGDGVDPASYGISADEQQARAALAAEIGNVLIENSLVSPSSAAAPTAAALSLSDAAADRFAAPAEPRAATAESSAAAAEDSAAAEKNAGAATQGAPAPSARAVPEEQRRARASAAPTPLVGVDQPSTQRAAPQAQAAFDKLAAEAGAAPARSVADRESAGERAQAQNAVETFTPRAPPAADAATTYAVNERQKRLEQVLVPEPSAPQEKETSATARSDDEAKPKVELEVRTFQSELDPFELGMLDTGHFVLYRNVWRDGRRYIQGALLDRERFIGGAVGAPFRASSLAQIGDVAVSYQGRPLETLRAAAAGRDYEVAPGELQGTVLSRARLSPPFGNVELAFGVQRLPPAPGRLLLVWVSLTLAVVLVGGFLFVYRFAVGQMRLARQQQDFVSAVSHELKTPLTSIRMYGEMLKAGWADEAKKQVYYDYIHGESERLSRLIENVLQLARLTRNTQHFELKRATVAEALDMVRSKVSTQVERAGFALEVRNDAPADAEITVDGDAFAQVFINLVDNALKFSASAERKAVEIASRRESDGTLLFTVRDFGPGIPKGHMKKIFELFYRPANELTRETVGTGIGLALVRQLTLAMGGRVDVRNCEPGAEFRLTFPRSR
ncbi:MAG TPA: HAMP domain-containing sensor histidine kinase [Gammaproteobacteria bacterium]|nr:HAMP domain-containing sensor histidine kinase [Gammaproteobacteria bacterium]